MSQLCLGCMQQKQTSPICELCGFDETKENHPHQLPVGTLLQNQYLVGKVLGQGGFGITYIGWDQHLSIPVAIKEYFPAGVVQRNTQWSNAVMCSSGETPELFEKHKEKFMKEARTLAQLSDISEIVQIKTFFPENGTAYIVMEYVQGTTLKNRLKQLGRPMTETEALEIMEPVLRGLKKVHEHQLIHRDISPDNIMLPKTGGVKLIDFGTVRYIDASGASKSTESILKPGFAPTEQYNSRGNLGPWTDVYAICATFHYLLTGKVPPEALQRLEEGEPLSLLRSMPGISKSLVRTLEKGMRIKVNDRLQTIEELYQLLYTKAEKKILQESVITPEKAQQKKKKSSWIPITVAGICAAAFIGILAANPKDASSAAAASTAASSEAIVPETTLSQQALRYNDALALMEAGNYTDAMAAFAALNGYEDSREKYEHCSKELAYQEAALLEQAGETGKAAIAFGKLDGFRDSRKRSLSLWAQIPGRQTITTSSDATIGIRTDGTVAAVGDNKYGECNVENWHDIVSVAAGPAHTLGLKIDGTVVAVGFQDNRTNVQTWTDIISICAGKYHSVGLRADGTVVAVGLNNKYYGECNVTHWSDVVSIGAAMDLTVGITKEGTVVIPTPGSNPPKDMYSKISGLADLDSISMDTWHWAALKKDGTVLCASNGFVPRYKWDQDDFDVEGWTDIIQIAVGTTFTLGLRSDGTVLMVGSPDDNELVKAPKKDQRPVDVSEWTDIVSISAAANHAVGLKADGTVLSTGTNNSGELYCSWTDIQIP